MAGEVLLDVSERVATITLNRPDKMNTINSALGSQLIEALVEVRNNDEIRSAVITGAGDRAFCAGADLTQGDGPPPQPVRPDTSLPTRATASTVSTRRSR